MATIYNKLKINNLTEEQLSEAKNRLKELDIFCGNEFSITGLSGWIFEQVIHYCLKKELEELGFKNIPITEQETLEGRKKVDLTIGDRIVIEIKAKGIFGKPDVEKYSLYKQITDEKNLIYIYITGSETVPNYKESTMGIFGKENTFFLDDEGDWQRFVNRIVDILKQS